MKNLKVVFAFLPLLALVSFIYFSASGFSGIYPSHTNTQVQQSNAPSGVCEFQIHINSFDPDLNCMVSPYTVCINGGPPFIVSGDFNIRLDCDETYEICVQSSSGCTGSTTIHVECPCGPNNSRTITLSAGGSCHCS